VAEKNTSPPLQIIVVGKEYVFHEGCEVTVHKTWLTFDTQSVPVLLRRLSIRLVPLTAGKLGIVELHGLQTIPLSVEYLYSSVLVPVLPLPGVVIDIVSAVPSHTVASDGFLAITGAKGSETTVHDTWLTFDTQPVPVLLRLLSIRLVPVTAVKLGIVVLQGLQAVPLSVEYLYSSLPAPVPPLPGVVIEIVNAVPSHTVASDGFLAITGAKGSSTTAHDTWLTFDTQPVPVLLRRLSIRLVPVTAGKLGIVILHGLQTIPLSVEYLYSSVLVPVPPLPGVVIDIVKAVPSHTVASVGFLAITGAMGSATTIHDTWFTFDAQSVPVLLRLLSTRFVPETAVKLGIVVLQGLQDVPLSVEYLYSSVFVPVPPLPGVVTVTVNAAPPHTVASEGLFDMTGATGSATTVHET
jgi:hypothetical protein